MRLVKVKHYRCGEFSASTWAMAPDEWSDRDVDEAAQKAQQAYLEALKMLNEKREPPNGYHTGPVPLSKYHGWKVEDAEADWAKQKVEYDAWQAERRKGDRRFEEFLKAEGFTSIWSLSSDDVTTASVDWGHRHGMGLRYGDDRLDEWPAPDVMLRAIEEAEDW